MIRQGREGETRGEVVQGYEDGRGGEEMTPGPKMRFPVVNVVATGRRKPYQRRAASLRDKWQVVESMRLGTEGLLH